MITFPKKITAFTASSNNTCILFVDFAVSDSGILKAAVYHSAPPIHDHTTAAVILVTVVGWRGSIP